MLVVSQYSQLRDVSTSNGELRSLQVSSGGQTSDDEWCSPDFLTSYCASTSNTNIALRNSFNYKIIILKLFYTPKKQADFRKKNYKTSGNRKTCHKVLVILTQWFQSKNLTACTFTLVLALQFVLFKIATTVHCT